MITFAPREFKDGTRVVVPFDLELVEAQNSSLPLERQHVLIGLAWHAEYVQKVPPAYRAFFEYVLPQLHTRTTDVHSAVSVSFVSELLAGEGGEVDELVLYAALILHDSGWSRVSEAEIADSLDGRGVRHHSGGSRQEPHDIYGADIAREILPASPLAGRLGSAGQTLVADLVGHHTWGEFYRPEGRHLLEMDLLCDADRLWSYTYENFWQDVVRKRVPVERYRLEVERAIPFYFITGTGRAMAKRMIAERRAEVGEYERYIAHNS